MFFHSLEYFYFTQEIVQEIFSYQGLNSECVKQEKLKFSFLHCVHLP